MANIVMRPINFAASGYRRRDSSARTAPRRRAAPVRQCYELQRGHPGRRLDWRWQLASDVVANRRNLPATLADDFLRQAVEFRRKGRRGRATRRHPRFYEHLVQAVGIEGQAGRQKALVQAWLLAEVSLDEVAEQCAIPVGVVAAYEALFFSTKDRLAARDWIMVRAIGLPTGADGQVDVARLWRLLAYFGGAQVLETTISAIPLGWQPDEAAEAPLVGCREGRRAAWAMLFAAATALPNSIRQNCPLTQVAAILREIERLEGLRARADRQLTQTREALSVAKQPVASGLSPPSSSHDRVNQRQSCRSVAA